MTTPQTALAVIEEALRAAAYTDDFAPDYAKREAPAVLSRVLAALGGEPVAWRWCWKNPGRSGDSGWGYREDKLQSEIYAVADVQPLYAHPAPPIDLAAIPAEVWAWYEAEKLLSEKNDPLCADTKAMFAALRKIKDAEPAPQPGRDWQPYRGE